MTWRPGRLLRGSERRADGGRQTFRDLYQVNGKNRPKSGSLDRAGNESGATKTVGSRGGLRKDRDRRRQVPYGW